MKQSSNSALRSVILAVIAYGYSLQLQYAAATPGDAEPATNCLALAADTVAIPAGEYRQFFKDSGRSTDNQAAPDVIHVKPFQIDVAPVTRAEYLNFVCRHPEWRKSRVKALFAEDTYLADWAGDLDPNGGRQEPVTHVSWFAARAYCASRNARLPTIAEWERVAGGSPQRRVRPMQSTVGNSAPFRFAMGQPAEDLQGAGLEFPGVWEWSADFNGALALGSGRGSGSGSSLFCGDGYRSNHAEDYAAFLRYSFRSSLRASYALKNLGFRCALEKTS